jgi:hypothetical protein
MTAGNGSFKPSGCLAEVPAYPVLLPVSGLHEFPYTTSLPTMLVRGPPTEPPAWPLNHDPLHTSNSLSIPSATPPHPPPLTLVNTNPPHGRGRGTDNRPAWYTSQQAGLAPTGDRRHQHQSTGPTLNTIPHTPFPSDPNHTTYLQQERHAENPVSNHTSRSSLAAADEEAPSHAEPQNDIDKPTNQPTPLPPQPAPQQAMPTQHVSRLTHIAMTDDNPHQGPQPPPTTEATSSSTPTESNPPPNTHDTVQIFYDAKHFKHGLGFTWDTDGSINTVSNYALRSELSRPSTTFCAAATPTTSGSSLTWVTPQAAADFAAVILHAPRRGLGITIQRPSLRKQILTDDHSTTVTALTITQLDAQANSTGDPTPEEVFRLGGGYFGDPDVLTTHGLRLMTINPRGNMSPEFGTGTCAPECHLPLFTRMLRNNFIHIIILPESQVNYHQTRSLTQYVTSNVTGANAISAPSSSRAQRAGGEADCHLLLAAGGATIRPHGAVTALLSPIMASMLHGTPKVLAAGRGLFLTFKLPPQHDAAGNALPARLLHVLALYGVSSATSSPDKKSIAADLAKEIRAILREFTELQWLIGIGDYNAAACDHDRSTGKLVDYEYITTPHQTHLR